VQSALSKVSGVISAEVTFPDKAVVKVEKGKVKNSQLIEALKKAGYTAKVKTET
jgi:copper chaperone CopZ